MRNFILSLALLCNASLVFADSNYPDVKQVIKDNIDYILSEMKEDEVVFQNNPKELYKFIEDSVFRLFDTKRITKLILGKWYKQLDPEEIEEFTEEFRKNLIMTISTSFFSLKNIEEVEYGKPIYIERKNRVIANMGILVNLLGDSGRPSIKINFSLILVKGHWRIYNLTAEGISFILNYRAIYNSSIQQHGIRFVIDSLKKINNKFYQ